MGGEYFADENGVLELQISLPHGGRRTVRIEGYEPGEEIYCDLTSGRGR